MRALTVVALTACIILVINGCSGRKMMEPTNSEMSSMEKPMDKTMKDEPIIEDAATEPMKSKMEPMKKITQ